MQDPNIANAQGNTALHWACVNGHGEVVETLLAKGAKTTICNAGGRTALDEAMHNDRQVRKKSRVFVSPHVLTSGTVCMPPSPTQAFFNIFFSSFHHD